MGQQSPYFGKISFFFFFFLFFFFFFLTLFVLVVWPRLGDPFLFFVFFKIPEELVSHSLGQLFH